MPPTSWKSGFGTYFAYLDKSVLVERFIQSAIKYLSTFINKLDKVKPIYTSIKGWKSSTVGITSFDDLPEAAREYILYLEQILNIPIKHISTGPKRNDIIIR